MTLPPRDYGPLRREEREKGNAERLQLPAPVIAIIAAQAELRLNEFVFPASRVVNKSNKPGEFYGSFSAFGQGKAELDQLMLNELHAVATQRDDQSLLAFVAKIRALLKAVAVEKDDDARKKLRLQLKQHWWVLHDLRRTGKSLMIRAGIRPDISERVLGHTIAGVEGVYDRHSYDSEREAALVALATLIETILRPPAQGGNVVSINRR